MAYEGPRSYRPVIIGRRGAVASNHPLATQAGLLTLQAGGNAVDAAVAVAATLSVVEPFMSGLGGDGFYHVHDRRTGESVIFNGTGPAPSTATPERYTAGIPMAGPLAVSVPGSVGAWGAMHARFGRRRWAPLLEAAVHYARDGFGATRAFRHFAGEQAGSLRADARSARAFLRGGQPPGLGAPIVQPDLARTLERLACAGADDFYRGDLARGLAAACGAAGSLVTAEDLAAFVPETQAPIELGYRGYTVREAPPNSMGWVLLQELGIVEHFDLATMGPLSADLVHTLVEAKKLAFADRDRWSGDPRFIEAPLAELLSRGYLARRAAEIDGKRAAPAGAAAGTVPGDTTYFCVVDGEGNAVSGIQSLNSAFGSGVTAGDTGILLNNRMTPWHTEPGHPNCLAPGKRVRHTMNPPMVFKDGELWAAFGTPGGDYQVQVNLQVLTAMVDFGYDPQQAAEMPRWSSTQPGQEANWPHDCPDALNLEARFPPEVSADLAGRGHPVVGLGELDGPCSVEIIRRDPATGTLMAGSDPRRDGWALAY
ncbi:MAG TPA: gamma-glutamyltransferase [Methylomirabilota bacterium]|jgi:gamma-glutamyltranspeptidase/glutathione hydrolase|nr:gamma-glutamyltransferase [Methylomirabilota bacterium]